ncbi:NUDIX domain-containing protein [Mycoplasma sp. 4044]
MKIEKSAGTLCVFLAKKPKILLVKNKNKSWGFPKGHLEGSEKAYQAATRETKEEANIDAKLIEKFAISQYNLQPDIMKFVYWFVATSNSNKAKRNPTESLAAKFVSFKKAKKMLTHETDRKHLQNFVSLFENQRIEWNKKSDIESLLWDWETN